MLPLLLWLALLLPGRVADPAALHHPGYDPTHQGLDVQSWLRRTPDGKPDLARTALDIRHNGLLRGAVAGLGWSLLLLALARRRGWAKNPWRAESLPGSALHNGTKAIHLGAWAGAMGLGMAILNGVGESLEPGQSRLPEAILLAGEGLFLVGAAGVWARRLAKKRAWRAVHVMRRGFDALLASTPQETPPEVFPAFPEGFDPAALERRVGACWDGFQAAWRTRRMEVLAGWSTPGMWALLAARAEALAASGQPDRRDEARLLETRLVHLHEDPTWAAATLRLSLRGPSKAPPTRPVSGYPGTIAWTEMWTFLRRGSLEVPSNGLMENVCPRCEAPWDPEPGAPNLCRGCAAQLGAGDHDWLLSSIVPESEWARPDPLRLERLAPLVRRHPDSSFRQIEDRALEGFAHRVRARNASIRDVAPRIAPTVSPIPGGDVLLPLVLAVDAMTSEVSDTESVVWVAVSWLAELPGTDAEMDSPRRTLLRMVRPARSGQATALVDPWGRQGSPSTDETSRHPWTITEIAGDDLDAPLRETAPGTGA